MSGRLRKVIAAVAVTLLTLAVIGVLVVTLTPIGCGTGNAIGVKSVSSRCAKPAALRQSPYPSPQHWSPPPFSPLPAPTYTPPPPYSPPASGPFPPDSRVSSSAYPPYFPPSSASGTFRPTIALNCRLPVYAGPPGSGGFIQFPGNTFVADPSSAVTLPAGATLPPGPGQAGWGMSYDKALSKWVPVPARWVSPDGGRYAFATTNSIWVQNVADDAHLVLGDGHQWVVVAFLSEGVYASVPNSPGLWLLSDSAAPRQIATTGYWNMATVGQAYGTATSAVPQGASNSIIKLDLKTGAITDWFARANSQAYVFGFDAQGHPIVQVNYQAQYGGNETWLTTGPATGTPIGGSSNYSQPQFGGIPASDSHGIWFQGYAQYPSGAAIVLFVPGSGLYWMSNIGGQLAGGCN